MFYNLKAEMIRSGMQGSSYNDFNEEGLSYVALLNCSYLPPPALG